MEAHEWAFLILICITLSWVVYDAFREFWPSPPTIEDHHTGARAYTLTDKTTILGVPYDEDSHYHYLADPRLAIPEEAPQPIAGVLHLPKSRVLYVQLLKEGQEF